MARKMSPNSLANLKKGRKFQKGNKICSKGGKGKAEKDRRMRTMREALEVLLQLPWQNPTNNPVADIDNVSDATKLNVTVLDKILLGQILAAARGSTRAAEFVRDTLGQTVLPNRTGDEAGTEYEDDGFTEAIKASAVDVWGERHGNKKKAANKAGRKVQKVQPEADAAADVVDGKVAVPET